MNGHLKNRRSRDLVRVVGDVSARVSVLQRVPEDVSVPVQALGIGRIRYNDVGTEPTGSGGANTISPPSP
jgi:hypothetical protein